MYFAKGKMYEVNEGCGNEPAGRPGGRPLRNPSTTAFGGGPPPFDKGGLTQPGSFPHQKPPLSKGGGPPGAARWRGDSALPPSPGTGRKSRRMTRPGGRVPHTCAGSGVPPQQTSPPADWPGGLSVCVVKGEGEMGDILSVAWLQCYHRI